MPQNLTFLKLGGSLITDKTRPLTAHTDVIARIAAEIARARHANPQMQLVIGHGSGSFGHATASPHQTQSGGSGQSYWQGFAEVWAAARTLNQIVLESLIDTGLPVIAFPPSAGVIATDKTLSHWDLQPLKHALSHHLIPVVQGDVIFDTHAGGTIFSTEIIFQYLARELHPQRILLAGSDPGVYQDYGQAETLIPRITPQNIAAVLPALSGAKALDVTGGMEAKVLLMLALAQEIPALQAQIFSGSNPNNIEKALSGETLGTLITATRDEI